MKYSMTEQAFRKLVCSVKDKINNHKHLVEDVEDLNELTDTEIEEICDFEEGMNEEDVIPKATKDLLGCVVVGDGLEVDDSGVLSNAKGMDLLWQNASPTSAFASQNINLDLSSYNFVLIGVNWGVTEPNKISYFPIQVGKSAFINIMYVQSARSRQIDVTTSKVVVGLGYTSAAAQNNKEAIPVEIYGIKGVS